MSRKKNAFVDAFDIFWDHVRQAERDVRENGHRGRLPPLCFGDPWDEDFATAYEDIVPYLRKFRRDRFFRVPTGLAFCAAPLRAETANQALMFFLNKPDELYGEIGVLDSPEYLEIKSEAMKELDQRDRTRRAPRRSKDLPCSIEARILGELANLRGYLWEYHFPKKGDVVLHLLTLKDLQRKFGWSQTTATHRMQEFFKCNEAMKAYARIFSRDEPVRGYRRRFEDGTLDVEAIYRERASRAGNEAYLEEEKPPEEESRRIGSDRDFHIQD